MHVCAASVVFFRCAQRNLQYRYVGRQNLSLASIYLLKHWEFKHFKVTPERLLHWRREGQYLLLHPEYSVAPFGVKDGKWIAATQQRQRSGAGWRWIPGFSCKRGAAGLQHVCQWLGVFALGENTFSSTFLWIQTVWRDRERRRRRYENGHNQDDLAILLCHIESCWLF